MLFLSDLKTDAFKAANSGESAGCTGRFVASSGANHGLQTKVRPVGSLAASSSDTPVGDVQRGPRFAGGTGSEIIASGPALCSPLNGVGFVTSNPHAAASLGSLNQKPT